MDTFTFQGLPSRVVFGSGKIQALREEVQRLDLRRVLVLSTPGQRGLGEQALEQLGDLAAGLYPHAVEHVPAEVARQATAHAGQYSADACLAIGGGSTIGLGKAIALASGLPMVAVPTTYAGSEMTPIYGLTENGLKKTGRDIRVLPRTVVYDPDLTLGLPPAVSACSGMNAMAHAIEALYAQDANPIVALMAEASIRSLASALPVLVADGRNLAARHQALYGAWLAGTCLGSVGMSLHHKLCHTLGGSFNLPHAQVHAILLPYTAHYNAQAAGEALLGAADALGGPVEALGRNLYRLNRTLGVPGSLRDIGFPEDGPEKAAHLACQQPYYNPRPFDPASIQALLRRAREGLPPD